MAWNITVQAARKHTGRPQDTFIMADGLKIARRGYPGTAEEGTWVPIEPGWEVKDLEVGEGIWVRYTNPTTGEVITFPEGEQQSARARRTGTPGAINCTTSIGEGCGREHARGDIGSLFGLDLVAALDAALDHGDGGELWEAGCTRVGARRGVPVDDTGDRMAHLRRCALPSD
jgi:hypothetical protein